MWTICHYLISQHKSGKYAPFQPQTHQSALLAVHSSHRPLFLLLPTCFFLNPSLLLSLLYASRRTICISSSQALSSLVLCTAYPGVWGASQCASYHRAATEISGHHRFPSVNNLRLHYSLTDERLGKMAQRRDLFKKKNLVIIGRQRPTHQNFDRLYFHFIGRKGKRDNFHVWGKRLKMTEGSRKDQKALAAVCKRQASKNP